MHIRRRSLGIALLVATAVAVPALAQQPSTSSYNTTCDKPPSAGDQDAAHASFILGKKAYDESDYQKAIDYMKDAYRLDCTKPELLTYIARAYEAKGDKAEAVAALEAYLKRNPKAPDVESVQRRIANLKAQLAAAPSGTTTASATATATTAPTTTPSATSAPTASATDGAPPPPAEGRGHTVRPWIVVGGGGLMVAGGVVMLVVGSIKVSDSLALCPDTAKSGQRICSSDADKMSAQNANTLGKTLQAVGAVVGIVGVAAVAGGLVWHFLEGAGPQKNARVRPDVGPGWLGLSGSF
jgi:tetratricopeptide (TPR) repeat protein